MKVWFWRVVFTATTLLLILVSFGFSRQQGSYSTRLSSSVIARITETEIFDGMTYREKAELIKSSDLYVRKAAHFTEYALLGVSLYFLCCVWFTRARRLPYFLTLALCLGCAAADELHQRFSAGRTASVTDVAIDFAGCVFACLIILAVKQLFGHFRRRRSAVF